MVIRRQPITSGSCTLKDKLAIMITFSNFQFLVLKLIQPAILHSIKFGKYERIHQCNIRRLKIYGGMSMDKLHLLYEG